MRNLSIVSKASSRFPEPLIDGEVHGKLTAVTVDVDTKTLYGAVEKIKALDGQLQVAVWKIEGDHLGSDLPLASLSCAPRTFSPVFAQSGETVSFSCLPENRKLCLIVTGGDIATASIEDEGERDGAVVSEFEVVGSVESGIKAASWSPDDDVLVLVTGNDELLLMTKDFDVLSETPLRKSEFGEDQNVNVGWGSKATQFHGSLGKSVAAASSEQAAAALRGGSSPDDDGLPRISWRGDGALFVISSLDPHAAPPETPERHTHSRRVLRVYDRNGALQSTSEPTPGLEQALAWRPSGGLIASAQRFGFPGGGQGNKGRHDVVFFEKNGLRHGEFGLRQEVKDVAQAGEDVEVFRDRMWGYRVKEMAWSSDSSVLAVWIERDDGDVVQLWTTGNYHWYLKQEIPAPTAIDDSPGRFTSVFWHPESSLRLLITTAAHLDDYDLVWDTCVSTTSPPSDSATVAVVDGASLLMTPFRVQNVPPPMSSYKIERAAKHLPPPVHTSFAHNADALALLYQDCHVELWNLQTNLEGGRTNPANPFKLWEGPIPGSVVGRQVVSWLGEVDEWYIAVLGLPEKGLKDVVAVIVIRDGKIDDEYEVVLQRSGSRLVPMEHGVLVSESTDGELIQVDYENEIVFPIIELPAHCPHIQSAKLDSSMVVLFGLSDVGKLYMVTTVEAQSFLLSSNCTSFTIGGSFLIFTTSAHEARFVPLKDLLPLINGDISADSLPDWEKRRVERGSKIVVAVPSAMSLVLQMPRGNLETINPRPLVLEVVGQDIETGDYRKAFLACRKHRIDLNILVDHDAEAFLSNLTGFIQQVHEVDYINLFLSGIGQSSQPPEKIAQICDAIRTELEKQDLKKYVNCILTSHVVKTPPDYEAGLGVLLGLQSTDQALVEDAVKYIIFLVDADKLFDMALGMYDFSLVLLIAQHSQRDPREYLPFLRELRQLEQHYQRYRIDDHLKRYAKALRGLHDAGPERFSEAQGYVEKHKLYLEALEIWKGEPEQLKVLLSLYGDYLFERREFSSAALAFVHAKKPEKAMVAYEKAHIWQELFTLALTHGVDPQELVKMGRRVGEDLSSRKRHTEAGRVILDYAKDIPEAIAMFVRGNDLAEAERLCAMHHSPELVESHIHPGALDLVAEIRDDFQEMSDQLDKQCERLQDLQTKKELDPDAFYMNEDSNIHNVDMMTEAGSMVGTAFTRYTVAPSATSRRTKFSSKSKRKAARNKGRKGTADEEVYILQSIAKLPARLHAVQADASKLLPHLLKYTVEHKREGNALQKDITDFEAKLRSAVDDIWDVPLSSGALSGPDEVNNTPEKREERPLKPELLVNDGWKVKFLEILY